MESVAKILELLNKEALVEAVSSLAGTPACSLDNSSPISGLGYVIFVISFPARDDRWAVRIPLDQEDSFFQTSIIPLQHAHKAPGVPAPRIHGYWDCGSSGNNPVGVGYMLLDWVEGSVLEPWDQLTPAVSNRHKILHQIADLMLNLITQCLPDDQTLFYCTFPLFASLDCSNCTA